jgi:hypothetical protein
MKNFDAHSPILKAIMKNIVLNEVKVMPQPKRHIILLPLIITERKAKKTIWILSHGL